MKRAEFWQSNNGTIHQRASDAQQEDQQELLTEWLDHLPQNLTRPEMAGAISKAFVMDDRTPKLCIAIDLHFAEGGCSNPLFTGLLEQ